MNETLRLLYDRFYTPLPMVESEQEVENCHRHGVKVNVWTVNGMEDLENIYEWGCDGAITNFPDVCKSWVEAKERNR